MYQIASMQEIYGYIYGNNSTIEQTDSFMACCKHLSLQVVSVHARLVASSYMMMIGLLSFEKRNACDPLSQHIP